MFITNIKSSKFVLLEEFSSSNWCFKYQLEQIYSSSINSTGFLCHKRGLWLHVTPQTKAFLENFNLKNGSIAGNRMLTNDIEKSPEEQHISIVFKTRSSVLRKLIKQCEKSIRCCRNVIRWKWKIMNAMWWTKVYACRSTENWISLFSFEGGKKQGEKRQRIRCLNILRHTKLLRNSKSNQNKLEMFCQKLRRESFWLKNSRLWNHCFVAFFPRNT